ncbi:MAG: methionyl-tRNA formyltransferase [bacterium]
MKILFFGLGQPTDYILIKLLENRFDLCGLVVDKSNNFEVQNLKEIAQTNKVPIYEIDSTKDQSFIERVKNEIQPDVILVAAFDMLLPKALYSTAKITAINMHSSYLPYYRGANPFFWAIANGEEFTGVTVHFLNERFDEGDIIAQAKVEIKDDDTMGTVFFRQKENAWGILQPILDQIAKTGQPPKGKKQPKGEFPKSPRTNKDDLYIKWTWPTKKILDRIRSLNPFSPAYAYFRDELVGIYQAESIAAVGDGPPGTVIALKDQGPVVKTANGALLIKVVMVGWRYVESGADFIARERVGLNEVFE